MFRFRNTGSGLHHGDMGSGERRSRGRQFAPFRRSRPLICSTFSPAAPIMTLVSIPVQSRSRRRRQRHHQDARRRRAALCALGAAGEPQGHGLRLHRTQRADREIFRDRARSARPRLCGGDDRLARAGPLLAPPARSAQGLCARLRRFRDRRRDLRAAGGAAGLPAALLRARPFHGRHGDAAGGACRQALVRPHGAVGADDRPARPRHLVSGAGAAEDDAPDGDGRPLCPRRQRPHHRASIPSSTIP